MKVLGIRAAPATQNDLSGRTDREGNQLRVSASLFKLGSGGALATEKAPYDTCKISFDTIS